MEVLEPVSMKSGLEGRNNAENQSRTALTNSVSMKSGLEGRNNSVSCWGVSPQDDYVSMKSGLEGRNNDRASSAASMSL